MRDTELAHKNRKNRFFTVFLFLFFSAGLIQAQDAKISATLERGIGLYKHENYDEALPILKQARQEDPASTLAAYYLGLDYKQLQDYKNAIPHLKDAVTKKPKIIGALIELIDALNQVGEYEEALTWIAEAEKEGIRPAQIAFLKGVILLKQEKNVEAITSFEKAKQLDNAMAQACDYQVGIARMKTDDLEGAQQAFKQVIILEPLSSMAQYANEYLEVLTQKKESQKEWKLSVGTAWQHDDNVLLKPDEGSLAANISNTADSREVVTANLEHNKLFTQRFGLKSQYLFYFAKQNDLGFYDTMAHSFVAGPNVYFKRSLLSFPVTYTHTLVNDKSYLSNAAFNSIYNFMIGDAQMGQVFAQYGYKNYLWTPSTVDENRDGNDLKGGLGWYLFFAKKNGLVNIRYEASKDWTKGHNWENSGNRVTTTVTLPIARKLKVTLSGSALFQDFSNTHTVFNVRREDTVTTLSSLVAYELTHGWEIQLQYTRIKDDSNIDVYSYTRNITSVGFQAKF